MADKTEETKDKSWWDRLEWLVGTGVNTYTKTLDAKNDRVLGDKVSDYIAEQTMARQQAGYVTIGDWTIKITDMLLLIGGTLGLLLVAKSAKSLLK